SEMMLTAVGVSLTNPNSGPDSVLPASMLCFSGPDIGMIAQPDVNTATTNAITTHAARHNAIAIVPLLDPVPRTQRCVNQRFASTRLARNAWQIRHDWIEASMTC